ncbi:MAG: hypothetical protein KME21_31455 [Desmonostoc vinosum HA7617-LM4]|nr:hypothetical protein [Desmonostoc vinosum HA7617-LM4]
MTSRFSSTISSVMHCQPYRGLGRAIVLFAFEETYLFLGGKSASIDVFGAIAGWLNLDQLIQSGRCKCITAPT